MGKVKRLKTNLRRSSNPFERKCSCAIHDPTVESKRLFTVTTKDFKKSDLKKLVEKSLISKKTKYVFDNCWNYENSDKREGKKIVDIEDTKSDASNDQRNIEDIEDEEEYQNERQEFDFDFINKTVKAINERQVSDSDIQNLYLALGKYFYDAVSEDIKNISRMYKNYDALKGLQVNDFLLERPKSLVLLIIT
jgi:hypothetical protein